MKDSDGTHQKNLSHAKIIELTPTKHQWQQLMGLAGFRWKRLTRSELHGSKGRRKKLASLVKSRYFISQTDAESQVSDFFSNNGIYYIFPAIEYHPGH